MRARMQVVVFGASLVLQTGCLARAFTGRVTRTVPAPDATSAVRLAAQVAREIGYNPRYINVAEGHVQAYRPFLVTILRTDDQGRVEPERSRCLTTANDGSGRCVEYAAATRGREQRDFTLDVQVSPAGNGRFKFRIEGGTPTNVQGGPSPGEIVDAYVRALDARMGRTR